MRIKILDAYAFHSSNTKYTNLITSPRRGWKYFFSIHQCESTLISWMHNCVIFPRPTTELSPLVITERLLYFRRRTHHKRPILFHWLSDGFPLQQQTNHFVSPT